MTYYPLNEVFPELGGGFPDAEVGDIKLNQDDRSLKLNLRFGVVQPQEEIDKICKALKCEFDLNSIYASIKYPESTLETGGISSAIEACCVKTPSARSFLKDSELSFDGNKLTIKLKKGGNGLLKSWAEELQSLLFQWYGRPIGVELEMSGTVEELIKKNDSIKDESIEKEVKKIPAAKSKAKKSKGSSIMGRRIKAEYTPMSDISLDTGRASIKGTIFAINHREIKKRNAYILCFDMTDHTGSVRINSFMEAEKAKPIIDELCVGMTVAVKGRISFNKFENDIVMDPESITLEDSEDERTDDSDEKRVELHLHTQMSSMDAVVGPRQAVRRAANWGHRAVAITDHGVVQAFPEAMAEAAAINKTRSEDDKFKVIYGVECYYVNDIERLRTVYGDAKAPISGEFVAFDIETTGLSPKSDRIIEIGAVIFKNGEVLGSFNALVNPGRPIPQKITQLTGIDDSMVAGADSIDQVLPKFLEFVGGRVLAAHNATFDISFISEACRGLSIEFDPTFIDSRNMSRGMLQGITKFDLESVAKELNIPAFNHHRASDDAGVVAYILENYFAFVKKKGITDISELNSYIGRNSGSAKNTLFSSNHMILLVQNQVGLQNLYELVSLAHLEYYRRVPIIPRSELERCREGILIGSACESGELYRAVLAGKSDKECLKIAEFYDFLEIQPLGNNEFLLRDGKVKDRNQLIELNKRIVQFGETLGKPVVGTCDVHFMEPRDEVYRRILMAGKGFSDADNQAPLYFRTTKEMFSEFDYLTPEKAREVVVINPNLLADRCEFVRPVKEGTYSPDIEGAADELHRLVEDKVHQLYGETPPPEVRDRVDEEMNSIIKHHFDVIYMIAQKLVAKSLEDGYLVGSRGSVGSSVVAFFSGITEVNSLPPHYRCPVCKNTEFVTGGEYATGSDLPDKSCALCGTQYDKDGFDIPFATFLGFDGDKKPDIDLNFSGDYQSRAHKETEILFGKGQVFRAGTIGTLAEKTAYGYVKKYMEERGHNISRAEENRLIQGIIGVKRTTGQHPGGLIVVPRQHSIYEFCPIQHPADDLKTDIITTHFDYHSIEENLLKLDLLGHDDPTMIRMLFDLTGVDPQTIPLDDKKTMSLFTTTAELGFTGDPICGNSGTFAVPEFGTKFVREMLFSTKPTTFDELIRISGLSHGTDVWLNNGQDIINNGIATLKEIISARDDIMLFLISKGLDRKLSFTIMESVRKGRGLKPEWEVEMRNHNVPEWYLESCKKIKYMFPKAHAAAYVLMAFRIAWYKVHYPKEFYSAYFSIRANSFDSTIMTKGPEPIRQKMREIENNPNAKAVDKDMLTTLEVCYEFYKRGLTFESIDIYNSEATKFTLVGNGLRPPFTSIPGLGETAANDLVSARADGPFLSVEELSMRSPKVSKTILDTFREEGIFGDLPETSQVTLF